VSLPPRPVMPPTAPRTAPTVLFTALRALFANAGSAPAPPAGGGWARATACVGCVRR
jgi:hypothetical protein